MRLSRRPVLAALLLPALLFACGGDPLPAVAVNQSGLPTLGELWDMMQASTAPDSDGDFIPDDIEVNVLGTNPNHRDTDRDGLPDNYELFGAGLYDKSDFVPDLDNDGDIAPLDNDDDNDKVNDGLTIDTDGDGIANYLEAYGYVYDWLTGMFMSCEDVPCTGLTIYKTDPLQRSTDQDAYSDAMEASRSGMDVSVDGPGDHPLVPAYPNLVVELVGFQVTLNEDIEYSRGESLSRGTQWSEETSLSHSFTAETSFEVGVEVGVEFEGKKPKFSGKVSTKLGLSVSASHTISHTTSKQTSVANEVNWSETRSFNPTDAAHVKLMLKVHNYGTACVSNCTPTLTLKVAGLNVLTFEPGNDSIAMLVPGGTYPEQDGVYWTVDSTATGAPLSLTMNELRAFQSGAPISVSLTQVKADVLVLGESGAWESAGDCNEFLARCDSACANLRLDFGEGSFLHTLVYCSDGPSGPVVTLEDALALVAEVTVETDGYWITYTDTEGLAQRTALKEWTFVFDRDTWIANGYDPDDLQGTIPEGFEMGHLVLNPDSRIIGKAPRQPQAPKPFVHFAYLNHEKHTATVCATDYRGVEQVVVYVYVDDGSGSDIIDKQWPMIESGVDSSIFTKTFTDDEWAIVEGILDRRADPDPSITDVLAARAKSVSLEEDQRPFDVIPPNPRPVKPVIDYVMMDIPNLRLYAHVVPNEAYPPHWTQTYPVQWVRAYHEGFPGEFLEMKAPPNAFEDPYGWRCDLPAGWNDTDIRIVAYVAPNVWEHRYVQTSDVTSAGAQGPMDFTARFLSTPALAEWTWNGADFDASPPEKVWRPGLFTQPIGIGGKWKDGWNPSADEVEIYIRSPDLGNWVWEQTWQLFFNTKYKEVGSQESDFLALTASDAKSALDTVVTVGGSEILSKDTSPEKVYVFYTSDDPPKIVKLMITEVKNWKHWIRLQYHCKLSFRYVVFAEPNAVLTLPPNHYVQLDSGNPVELDGSASTGATSFAWYVDGVELAGETGPIAEFTPSKAATYEIKLVINENSPTLRSETIDSLEVGVKGAKITFTPDPATFASGDVVRVSLNGGGSVGATSYSWQLLKRPTGDTTTEINPVTKNSKDTSFDPIMNGKYLVRLTTNGGAFVAEKEITVSGLP